MQEAFMLAAVQCIGWWISMVPHFTKTCLMEPHLHSVVTADYWGRRVFTWRRISRVRPHDKCMTFFPPSQSFWPLWWREGCLWRADFCICTFIWLLPQKCCNHFPASLLTPVKFKILLHVVKMCKLLFCASVVWYVIPLNSTLQTFHHASLISESMTCCGHCRPNKREL